MRPRHTGGSFETLVVVSVLLPCGHEKATLLSVPSASLPYSEVNHHWHPPYLPEWLTEDHTVTATHLVQLNCLCHNYTMHLKRQLETPKCTHGLVIIISFYCQSKSEPPNLQHSYTVNTNACVLGLSGAISINLGDPQGQKSSLVSRGFLH